jgi:transposase InsO family protein
MMCEQLDVSISGYHQHARRKEGLPKLSSGSRRISNDALLAHIKAVHAKSKQEYGWPRIWKALVFNGIPVGTERGRNLMKLHGIRAKTKRKFKATTDSAHDLPVAPNLIARDFSPAAPDRVWTTDITYLATDEGWLYLTVMLELFSRRVVGWSIGPRMTSSLVTDALRMAWFRRHPPPGLIVHSDRGAQYCGKAFQKALKAYGMRSSMSRKADCWDNAPTESLWGSLKRARVQGRTFKTRDEAKAEVMDWLAFYNASRLHSTLGYRSPMNFEKSWWAAQQRKSA